MTPSNASERGAAMVLALGVLAVLAVLALIVVAIVVAEKKGELSDYSGTRSFYSADAATEAGVHWIGMHGTPPALLDTLNNVQVSTAYTSLSNDHRYRFDVQFVRKRPRAGSSLDYRDYEYSIAATGASAQQSQSAITLGAKRLYREGY
jgi:Tfp pilus assembly protein PilX